MTIECQCPPEESFHRPSCPYFDPALDPPDYGSEPPLTCGSCGNTGLVDDEPCFDCDVAERYAFRPDSPADPDRRYTWRDCGE